ncbi:MAG: DUF1634 domain-containing protein [Lentisphaeria bacterium]
MSGRTGTTYAEGDLGRLIQRTLQIGVWLAVGGFAAGLAARLAGWPEAARTLWLAGVVVLVLTPVARVAMLAFGYWRAKEPALALAALVVLATLVLAALLL